LRAIVFAPQGEIFSLGVIKQGQSRALESMEGLFCETQS